MKSIRLDVAVGAVVLMPFLAVGLGFRSSLAFQAIGILVVVAASLSGLGTAQGRDQVIGAPRLLIVGIVAVVIATVSGAVVGLIQGHGSTQIAGQFLSMGLLPLAAVGGLATWKGRSEGRWRTGLLVAIVLGCWIQLAWGFVMIVVLGEPSRLFLPNSVSVIGPALLGLCFALVSLADPNRWLRRLAWLAVISILLVILGSSLRSLWLLTPVTAVAVVAAWRGVRSRETGIALTAIVILGFGMTGAVWRMQSWVGRDLPDGLERAPCSLFPKAGKCLDGELEYFPDSARRLQFDVPVDLEQADSWRVMVRGHGEGQGAMVIALLFFDDLGREIGRIPVAIRAGSEGGVGIAVGTSPADWTEARLRLSRWQGSTGRWRLERVECAALDSPTIVRFTAKALAVKERARGLVRAAKTGRAEGDATLGFRWHESLKIAEAIKKGSWLDRIFGHGLGATIRLDVDGFDNRGHWVHYDDVNYIHNWYLFLMFKLGIVGTVLVLGAMIGWIVWTVRSAAQAADPEARAFLAAAGVAWIVYAVWSLTSPEILDFRMAPLWGWLLSVTATRALDEKSGNDRNRLDVLGQERV